MSALYDPYNTAAQPQGGNGMAFGWDDAALFGGSALAGLFSGGQQQQPTAPGNLHLVNTGQQALWNQVAKGLNSGAGDFGFGGSYKAGKGQINQMMADSGIKMDPSSGVYAGAMGAMAGQAGAMDAQARRDYTMGLLRTPLQTAMISEEGRNMIPGAPTQSSAMNQSGFNRGASALGFTGGGGYNNNY